MVSIIIPFFNLENYLDKSINSALSQTYINIEIILINDGSTDRSSKIAGKYKTYDNVTVISTENIGPGNARNVGLAEAKGSLIVFLDGDDWLQSNMVEKMVAEIKNNSADIVLCKFRVIDNENISVFEGGWKLQSFNICGSEAIKNMYSHKIAYTIWAKMFKREVIDNIKFPEKLIFEDRPFMLEAFINSKNICYLDEVLINILKRDDSLTRKAISKRRIKDLTAIYKIEKEIVKKYNLKSLENTINSFHIYALRDAFFLLENEEMKLDEVKKIRKVLIEEVNAFFDEIKLSNQTLILKDKLHVLILKFPRFFGWKVSMMIMNTIYR